MFGHFFAPQWLPIITIHQLTTKTGVRGVENPSLGIQVLDVTIETQSAGCRHLNSIFRRTSLVSSALAPLKQAPSEKFRLASVRLLWVVW